MEFTTKRHEIIVPSPPSHPHILTLSNIDQIMPPFYISTLYFFPPSSTSLPSISLTQSLSQALAAFPPAAGRLKPRSNGVGTDVECHNQGAMFVEAHTTITLNCLLTTGKKDVHCRMYQPSPLWDSLAPDPSQEKSLDKPLLFTQMTRLGCGGVVMAVVLHHLVADGFGQAHFTKLWTELARGNPISAHPHLDRTCMQARFPPYSSFEHQEYIVHKSAPSGLFNTATKDLPPTSSRIFEFLPQDIQSLKEQAHSKVGGDDFTGFHVLVAHIWKYVAKAHRVKGSQPIKLGWALEGRNRFNPRLPSNYFGNVVFYGYAEERAEVVMAQPLHDVAMHIRCGTQRITSEYMRSAVDLIAIQSSPALVTGSCLEMPTDLFITSLVNFNAYEMDWGWGPPLFFTPTIPKIHISRGGIVTLLPHSNRRAINALITLFEPQMDALSSDNQFFPISKARL